MELAVFNSAWSAKLALKDIPLVVSAAAGSSTTSAAPADSALPAISGTAQVGKVLTTTTGTWTGATSYAYKWAGNGTAIAGATASTYTPVSSDVGHTLTAIVTATGPGGSASVTSAPTSAVAVAAAAPVDSSLPVISGTAQVGKVQTSTTGTWTGATSFAYQWARNGAVIAGALGATYTPVSADAGNTLTATVTATGVGGAASATSAPTVPIVAAASSGSTFVALHTYYMSPTGSDSNNGLTVATAWATPNHPGIVCGDVIIAQPGAYTRQFGYWQAPTGCPSTSGGIDGTGGVYFATVVCATAFACTDTQPSGNVFDVTVNNIAIEGWVASAPAGQTFKADACASGTTHIHHVAFINDISYSSNRGFGTDECALNHNVPGNGVDEMAIVGAIAQSSNNDPICLAAFDDVAPSNFDSNPGTHVFWAGDFAMANDYACNPSDGEGMMFDTWDAHGYTGQGVIEQSVIYKSARYGLQIFRQGYNPSYLAPMFVFNNTFYSNNVGAISSGYYAGGDINIQGTNAYPIRIYNNIAKTGIAQNLHGGTTDIYALLEGGNYSTTIGGSGLQNIFKGLDTRCVGPSCDSGNNVIAFNGGSYGTNTYMDPLFANTTDLLTNRVSTPNCSGYSNVAACMGWNGTSATNPSVIYDLTPTASGTAGKGYQPPGPCTADPYFPTWLKGVVYLQWNGTSITENSGLITMPCGM
jgi:hypothetical protein